MPKLMTIVPAKQRPDRVTESEWTAIKRGGDKVVPALTAFEAVKNSKGAYQIKPESQTVVAGSRTLEEMPNSELKQLAIQMGVKFQKKHIQRSSLINLVRRKMDEAVEVVADDDEVQV